MKGLRARLARAHEKFWEVRGEQMHGRGRIGKKRGGPSAGAVKTWPGATLTDPVTA